MKRNLFLKMLVASLFCASGISLFGQQLNTIKIDSFEDMRNFFKYTGDGSIIISGHRGGREKGFPENCISGMENAIKQAPMMFEIDPRLTKDGQIILMHDSDLKRTSNTKGKVSDFTLEELRKIKLKDYFGNITEHRVCTLEEAIEWSKGKTILNLDQKGVPLEKYLEIIEKLDAKNVMLTVHSGEQARRVYDKNPNVMMSIWVRNDKEFESIKNSGVPYENFIAYVGASIASQNKEIVEFLRSQKVRCMIAFGPSHDKLQKPSERQIAYLMEVLKSPDIIESDIPVEVYEVVKNKDALKKSKAKELGVAPKKYDLKRYKNVVLKNSAVEKNKK